MWPFDRGGRRARAVSSRRSRSTPCSSATSSPAPAYALVQSLRRPTIRSPPPCAIACRSCSAAASPPASRRCCSSSCSTSSRFYTANLLLGPRWMAVVPALIVGFYALYVAKASDALAQRSALAIALACFVFVAWSWSELHELMQADPVWRDVLRGRRSALPRPATIAPRLVVLVGAMATSFAMVAAWSADRRRPQAARARRSCSPAWSRPAARSGCGRPGSPSGPAARVARRARHRRRRRGGRVGSRCCAAPSERALAVATGAGTGALVAAVIVREAPRVALIEPTHHARRRRRRRARVRRRADRRHRGDRVGRASLAPQPSRSA